LVAKVEVVVIVGLVRMN